MNILENNVAMLNEVIFEHRNKKYGAYAIRSAYSNTIFKSLGITCLIFLSISLLAMAFSNTEEVARKIEIGPNIIPPITTIYTAVNITPLEKPAASMPKQKTASAPKTAAVSTHFNDHADELKKEPLQTTDAHPTNGTEPQTSAIDPAVDNGGAIENTGIGTGTKLIGTAVTEAERAPDKLPSLDNMASFLRKNLQYPYRAKEEGVSGSVWVNFIIDEEGNIMSANILHGAGYGFDEEALRVIKLMPKWKPGMKNGKPVKVSFTQPITFRLQ